MGATCSTAFFPYEIQSVQEGDSALLVADEEYSQLPLTAGGVKASVDSLAAHHHEKQQREDFLRDGSLLVDDLASTVANTAANSVRCSPRPASQPQPHLRPPLSPKGFTLPESGAAWAAGKHSAPQDGTRIPTPNSSLDAFPTTPSPGTQSPHVSPNGRPSTRTKHLSSDHPMTVESPSVVGGRLSRLKHMSVDHLPITADTAHWLRNRRASGDHTNPPGAADHSDEDGRDTPMTPTVTTPTMPLSPPVSAAPTPASSSNPASPTLPQSMPSLGRSLLPVINASRIPEHGLGPLSPTGRVSLTVNKPPMVPLVRPQHRSIDFTSVPANGHGGADWLATELALVHQTAPIAGAPSHLLAHSHSHLPPSHPPANRPNALAHPPHIVLLPGQPMETTPAGGQGAAAAAAGGESPAEPLSPYVDVVSAAAQEAPGRVDPSPIALARSDLTIDVDALDLEKISRQPATDISPSSASGQPSSSSAAAILAAAIHADFKRSVFNHLLSDEQLRKFIALFRKEHWKAGETICEEGEKSERLIVFRSGQVLLYAKKPPAAAGAAGAAAAGAGATSHLASSPSVAHRSLGPRHDSTPMSPGSAVITSYQVLDGKTVKIIKRSGGGGISSPGVGGAGHGGAGGDEYSSRTGGREHDHEADMPYFDSPATSDDVSPPLAVDPPPLSVRSPSPTHSSSMLSPSSRAQSSPVPSAQPAAPAPPVGMLQLACLSGGSMLGAELLLDVNDFEWCGSVDSPKASSMFRRISGIGGGASAGAGAGGSTNTSPEKDSKGAKPKDVIQRRLYTARVSPSGPAHGYVISATALSAFLHSNANLQLVFHIGLGAVLPSLLAKQSLFSGINLGALGVLWSLGNLRAYKTNDTLYEECAPTLESTGEPTANARVRFICKGSVLLSRRGLCAPGIVDSSYAGHKYRAGVDLSPGVMDAFDAAEREAERLQEVERDLAIAHAAVQGMPPPPSADAKVRLLNHESIFGLEEVLLGVPFTQSALTLTPTLLWEVGRKTLIQWSALQMAAAPLPASSSAPSLSSRASLHTTTAVSSATPPYALVASLAKHWDEQMAQVIFTSSHASSLLLHCRPFQKRFSAFLEREYSSENLRFIVYTARFRNLPIHDAIVEARKSAAAAAAAAASAQVTLTRSVSHKRTPSANLRKSIVEANFAPPAPASPASSAVPAPTHSPLLRTHTSSDSAILQQLTPSLESSLLEMLQIAQSIYDQFLSPTKSPYQLQLHMVTRGRILHKLSQAAGGKPCQIGVHIGRRLFRDAEHEIVDLLQYDSFVRFRCDRAGALFKQALADMLAPTEKGFITAGSQAASARSPSVNHRSFVGGVPSALSGGVQSALSRVYSGIASVTRNPFASLLGQSPERHHPHQQQPARTSTNHSVKSGSYRLSAVEWNVRKEKPDAHPRNRTPEPLSPSHGGALDDAPDAYHPPRASSPASFLRFLHVPTSAPSASIRGGAASAAATEAEELEAINDLPMAQRRASMAKRRTEGMGSPHVALPRLASATLNSPSASGVAHPVFAGAALLSATDEADAQKKLATGTALGELRRELLGSTPSGQPLFASFQVVEEPTRAADTVVRLPTLHGLGGSASSTPTKSTPILSHRPASSMPLPALHGHANDEHVS